MATRDTLLTIRTDFGSSGLDNAGSRIRTEEASMWQAKNAVVDYRGVLIKRPEMLQLGHVINDLTDPLTSNGEMVSVVIGAIDSDWKVKSFSPNHAQLRLTQNGLLNFYGSKSTVDTTSNHKIERPLKPGEEYNTSDLWDGNMSFGFNIRTKSMFPGEITNGDQPGLYYRVAVNEVRILGIAITDEGIYLDGASGGFNKFIDSEGLLSDGVLHTVRFDCIDQGVVYAVHLYVDGIEIGSTNGLGVLVTGMPASTGQYVDVEIKTDGTLSDTDSQSGDISSMFVRDSLDAQNPATIEAVFSRYKYREDGANNIVRVYAATNKGLWFDENSTGVWRYAGDLLYPQTNIADFRDSSILINYGNRQESILTQIKNDFTIVELDDAPNIRFAVTHNNKLWGAGDPKYPLRVYHSGDRDPNEWFSPDTDADGQETFDEAFNAGYFEMDSFAGDEVSCLWGDFRGNLIVATRANKVFRIGGNDHLNFFVERLDDASGALGPHCMERVGNDLWIVGETGILMLQAVQEFGDIAVKRISMPIQNVFSKIGLRSQKLVPQLASETELTYEKSTDTVYLSIRQPDGFDDLIYTFRMSLGKWHGPWEQDVNTASVGPVIPPTMDTFIIGNGLGQVLFRTDNVDTAVEVVLESPVLTGRSVAPQLAAMEKTWRNFRLLVNPTGSHTFTLRYKVEDSDWETIVKELARSDSDKIGSSWTVGTSKVESEEELHVIDFIIGTKGRSLKWELTTDAPKISIIASEIEFSAAGFSRGD